MISKPILFIIFNRPDKTKKVFEAIRLAQPKLLFIAADGPRIDVEEDKEKCFQARQVVSVIDWECTVFHLFREENLGCGKAVRGALDWFFGEVEEGIILEDDVLPDQTFFQYCSEMLDRYKDEYRIGTISGSNLWDGKSVSDTSYFFSRHVSVWGWASWRRSWVRSLDYYDRVDKKDKQLLDICKCISPSNQRCAKFLKAVRSLFDGLDTWDYQWCLCNYATELLVVRPNVNLTANIGFGKDASHTKTDAPSNYFYTEAMTFPLVHPNLVIPDFQADEALEQWWLGDFNSPVKKKNLFISILNKFKSMLIL